MARVICHVITGLGRGGAESFLRRLITNLPSFDHRVVVLGSNEDPAFGQEFEAVSTVTFLNMKPSPLDFLKGAYRLRKVLTKINPDVIQGWMHHGNFLSLLGGAGRHTPVLWNIRNGPLDPSGSDRLPLRSVTNIIAKVGAWASSCPTHIVCCSENAAKIHQGWGYRSDKFVLIPNGIDLKKFQPNPATREEIRASWGISPTQQVVGFVGRFHPQKDIPTFLKALNLACANNNSLVGVMYGRGLVPENTEIQELLTQLPHLKGRIQFLGPRGDMENVYPGFDVLMSSSCFGEAFPNVLAEAMACRVVCVATNVGDAALILGTQGRVCPIKNPAALAEALGDVLSARPHSQDVRAHIQEHYSMERCVQAYKTLYS